MRPDQASVDVPAIFDVLARALSLRPHAEDRHERFGAAPRAHHPPRRRFLDALGAWLWRSEQRSVEAYLAQSRDIHDLEARIRKLERDPYLHY